MTENRRRNTFFAIVTLAPFVAFAVIEFAPWWVSTPFAVLAFLWWFGALMLLGQGKGDDK